MNWTEDQLSEYLARRNRLKGSTTDYLPGNDVEAVPADDIPESALQRKIERYCEGHAFYVFHDRSKCVNKKGFPDLLIALHHGVVLFCELKSRSGRLTTEQKMVRLHLIRLGHQYHVVKSFKQFLGIVEAIKAAGVA